MKLSIVTINLNNISGLKKTVESVLSQTFTYYEFSIIDGASIVGSVDLIKQNKKNISFWQSKKDGGIYNAINQGIKKSNGEYVMFLHSGDYFLDEDSLNRVFNDKPDFDIIYADAKRLNLSNNLIEVYEQPSILTELFFYRYSLCHQSMFFKRNLFDEFGFYREDLKIVSDWAFNLTVYISGKCTWKHLPTPIVYYDVTGISSNEIDILDKERDLVLKDMFSEEHIEQLKKQFLFRQTLVGRILINLKIIRRF